MSDKNIPVLNDFEESFEKSLRSLGYLFPATDEEVTAFESLNKIENTHMDIPSANDILRKGRITSIAPKNNFIHTESSENLAMAARNGKEIPVEIKRKMNTDRKESENEE
jgi:hypothetical protein